MKYITDDYSFGDIAEMISDISSLPIEKRLPKIFDLYDRFIAGDQDDFYFFILENQEELPYKLIGQSITEEDFYNLFLMRTIVCDKERLLLYKDCLLNLYDFFQKLGVSQTVHKLINGAQEKLQKESICLNHIVLDAIKLLRYVEDYEKLLMVQMERDKESATRDIEYHDFVNKTIDDVFNEVDYSRLIADFYEQMTNSEIIVAEICSSIITRCHDDFSEQDQLDEVLRIFEFFIERWHPKPLEEECISIIKKLSNIPDRWNELTGELRTEFHEFKLGKLSSEKLSFDNHLKSSREVALTIMQSVFVSSWWVPLFLSSRKACSMVVGGVVLGGLLGTMIVGEDVMKEKSEKIFWEIIAPKIEARFAEASVVKIFNEAGEVLVRRKYILPIKSIVEKYFVEQWNETKESRERICCRIGYNQNLLNRDLLWLKKSCITLLKAVEGGVDINLDSFEDYKKDKFSL